MSVEKIQVFLDVVNGTQPQSALVPLLEGDDWLSMAVDVAVSERLATLNQGVREYRIRVYDLAPAEMEPVETEVVIAGEQKTVRGLKPKLTERVIEYSPWLPEADPRFTAPLMMSRLRLKHRTARMAIERR